MFENLALTPPDGLAADLASISPILVLLFAMVLNLVLGRESILRRTFVGPMSVTGRMLSQLQDRYNRPEYTDKMRRNDGLSTLATVIVAALVLGIVFDLVLRMVPFGWLLEAILIASALVLRSHFDSARVLAHTLDHGTEQGRATLALFATRDTAHLDRAGVCRAGVEITARSLCEGVLHPVIFYLLFGLPGLLVVRAISIFDRVVDNQTCYGSCFGWGANRLNRTLQWPAMLVMPVIVAIATALMGRLGRVADALTLPLRESGRHVRRRDGVAFAAFAGALGIKLAGPIIYYGHQRNSAWIGEGLGDADSDSVRQARRLFVTSAMVTALIVGLMVLLGSHFPILDAVAPLL